PGEADVLGGEDLADSEAGEVALLPHRRPSKRSRGDDLAPDRELRHGLGGLDEHPALLGVDPNARDRLGAARGRRHEPPEGRARGPPPGPSGEGRGRAMRPRARRNATGVPRPGTPHGWSRARRDSIVAGPMPEI